MKLFEQEKDEHIADSLIRMIEQDTGEKIFTLRILDTNEEDLEVLIVFEDKSVMMGNIGVQQIEGRMAMRMRGNYI